MTKLETAPVIIILIRAGFSYPAQNSLFLHDRQNVVGGILEPGDSLGAHFAVATAHDAFRIGLYVRHVVVLHANPALLKLFDSFVNIIDDEIENRMLRRMIIG